MAPLLNQRTQSQGWYPQDRAGCARRLEFEGEWGLICYQKVGYNSKEFEAKHIVPAQSDGVDTIKCVVRPGSRDTAWEVGLIPDSDYDVQDVLPVLPQKQSKKKQANKKKSPKRKKFVPIDMAIGQVFVSKIIRKEDYGLIVQLRDRIEALCPLGDLSSGYDQQELSRFRLGTNLKVQITSINEEGEISVSHSLAKNKEKFQGKPGRDGSLSLSGFSDEEDRLIALLDFVAESMQKRHKPDRNYAAKDPIAADLEVTLCGLYGAEKCSRVALFKIIGALYNRGWLDYAKLKDEIVGYVITHEGWAMIGGSGDDAAEIGAKKHGFEYLDKAPRNNSLRDEEADRDLDAFLDSLDEEESYIDVEIVEQPPEELSTPNLIQVKPDQIVTKVEPREDIDFDLAEEFIVKVRRIADIREQLERMKELEKEAEELERWMKENPEAANHAKRVETRLKQNVDLFSRFQPLFHEE